MKLFKRCLTAVLVVTLLSGSGVAVTLWGQGYRLYAVRTGSMAPAYAPGDLLVDAPAGGSYGVGDVVTFRSPDGLTTHRVYAATPEGLRTKGDANRTPDVAPVPPADVVGRVVAHLPHGGYLLVFLQQPAGITSTMTLTLSLFLCWSLFFPDTQPSRRRGARSAAR